MNKIDLVGMVAGICTTISFLPQVVKIVRTKHTRDISLPMYVIFSLGVFMWACYGFMTNSLPIILANTVTLALAFYILSAKVKYK
ncbi:MAG: SemiSWEET transporter [Candidatus Omnitrophica bacterium]|nr:SemiSWEET transporter [Candidatus Omnitrophota bacterium]MDD5437375.1 SemiSWEET transporter [Candidatus Omnitrophota bacterium]